MKTDTTITPERLDTIQRLLDTDEYGTSAACGEAMQQLLDEVRRLQQREQARRTALAKNITVDIPLVLAILADVERGFEDKRKVFTALRATIEEIEKLRAALVASDAGMQTLRAQHATACDERDAVRAMLLRVLQSATPKAREHPAMWPAWGDASELLGFSRDVFRVPCADKE